MTYFNILPEITYNKIRTKNIFKKYILNEDFFRNEIVFYRYSMFPGERLIDISEKAYGEKFYDWIIKLTNGMIFNEDHILLTREQIQDKVVKEGKVNKTHHIETIKSDFYKEGIIVDDNFRSSSHTKNINKELVTIEGEELTKEVSWFEYYEEENSKKKVLYILKPGYFRRFMEDFREFMNS